MIRVNHVCLRLFEILVLLEFHWSVMILMLHIYSPLVSVNIHKACDH